MPLTHFPHGVSSFGIPIYGQSPFPYNSGGNHYWVDSVNGSDGEDGKTWATAKASIFGTYGGYSLLTENQNDVLHVIGGASAYAESTICTWSKNYTHMVAETAPIMSGGRARLTNSVTTATAGEFVISSTGCVFSGIHWQFGASATATSLVGVALSGNGRNAFINCNFEGPIDAGIGAAVGQRMLTITSSQDNWFYGCKFGQRTILNTSATGAIVSFNGTNNTDNGFVDCIFTMYNSNTASAAVNFVQNAMPDSGATYFKNCAFHNCVTANIADVIRHTTAEHGLVHLDYCTLAGKGTLLWATNLKSLIFTTGPAGNAAGGVGVIPA